ncbi:hypothetical protein EYF80_051058 [Liparis tanakae]|uniref:Uncharacterized protein n=1 Tax=Liparis tanakae TaxID=230148 RepID=A0A4Z2FBY4_9TELE|nr:hypothetical protein EYF80_051058 [Liparis tanakae]
MQKDAEGCRRMQKDAEGCRRMQKDAEGCRRMQKDAVLMRAMQFDAPPDAATGGRNSKESQRGHRITGVPTPSCAVKKWPVPPSGSKEREDSPQDALTLNNKPRSWSSPVAPDLRSDAWRRVTTSVNQSRTQKPCRPLSCGYEEPPESGRHSAPPDSGVNAHCGHTPCSGSAPCCYHAVEECSM